MSSALDLGKWKMIRIDEKLHEELSNIGHYGDSMGDIIRRLLESYKNKENKK
jgi:negative regulator of replication initiation